MEVTMRIAVYPGSFDPFTNGHLDIVDRARTLFDKIIIAIAVNSEKTTLFSLEEREDMIAEVIRDKSEVSVVSFSGLLVEFARGVGAIAIIRGMRAVTDFEYEYAIYQMNRDLNPDLDTVFLLASKEYSFLSSTIIKEVARYGQSVSDYAPQVVSEALLRRFGHTV
jgi:pantetheine-phosphate adenylyltransferase